MYAACQAPCHAYAACQAPPATCAMSSREPPGMQHGAGRGVTRGMRQEAE